MSNDQDGQILDINGLFQGAMKMLGGVKGVADNAKKTAFGFVETIAALSRTAKALEQLVVRATQLVNDMEAPFRAMIPEYEKAAARMQRLAEALLYFREILGLCAP